MNDASLNQLSYADQASLRLSAEAAAQAHLQGINQERKSREDNVGTVLSNLKDIYDLQVKSAQDERSFNLDKWYKEQQVSSQQKQDAQTAIDSALKNGITPTDTQLAVVGINSIDGRVGGTMPWRANNEGNIKYGAFAKKYGATQGPAATDGGFFAVFPDQETGTKAKMDLLASSGYVNLTLDKAMKRWSNNGYGAEIAPNLKPYTIGEILRYPELTAQLSEAMKKAEGYKEGTMFNAVKKNNTLSDTQINSTAKQLNLKVEEIKAMTDDQINQAVTDQQNNVYYRLSN